MIPDTSWEPTPSDIEWQKQALRILKDDAVWAVPISESAFVVNNTKKKFTLLVGSVFNETNRRIAKVFKILGYTEDTGEDSTPDTFPPSFSNN
jgi:hypothetical protein